MRRSREMLGVPSFGSRIRAVNLRKRKEIYFLDFDVRKLEKDDFEDFIRGLRIVAEEISQKRLGSERYREGIYLMRDSSKSLVKTPRGIAILDPVFAPTLHLLNFANAVADIGLWWCAHYSIGKKFTSNLCKNPCFDYSADSYYHDGAAGNRAIALNPWNLENIGNLDTILGTYYQLQKTGTIGKLPFTYGRSRTSSSVTHTLTFIGSSTTSILSIILLIPTVRGLATDYTTCYDYIPAPPGTCSSAYYSNVFLPLWGIETDIPIVAGDPYKVVVEFYV